jgi:hypothetical protein
MMQESLEDSDEPEPDDVRVARETDSEYVQLSNSLPLFDFNGGGDENDGLEQSYPSNLRDFLEEVKNAIEDADKLVGNQSGSRTGADPAPLSAPTPGLSPPITV